MRLNKHQMILGLVALSSSGVFAAGFQLQEQNVTNLGTAFSGTAASVDNASQNFYNVASMTHTPCTNFSLVGLGILTSGHVDALSASNSAGIPIVNNGDAQGHPGVLSFVPSFGVAHRLDDHWFLGFNVASPFGLTTRYGEGSDFRFVATRSVLTSIDFTPSVAYRFNKHWSAGVGYNYTFVRAHLDANLYNPAAPDAMNDGYQKNEGDDWVSSYKIGLLWDLTDATRFGVQYRSKMDVGIRSGKSNLIDPVALGGTGVLTQTLFDADVVLPEEATLSVHHNFSPSWTLLGDVSWVNWSRFSNLTLRFRGVPTAASIAQVNEAWKDSWRVALGMEQHYNDKWTFRFGAAFDQSPVDSDHRTARIADNDRIWTGIGTTYHLNKHVSMDAGYDHLFIKRASFTDKGPVGANGLPLSATVVVAESYGKADVFGLQMNVSY